METEQKVSAEEQTSTQAKYDRQIRLWGINGQLLLLKSKICLLGCDPAGVETLKNLILPGVGDVTIVDGQLVTERDLGNNFFCELEDLGRNRSEVIKIHLLELNSDVKGDSLQEDPSKLINTNPDYLRKFTLIIANNLSESTVRALGKVCASNKIRLIIIRASGFIGSIRVYGADHEIVEGKPMDKDIDGYKIAKPFPELQQFVDSLKLDAMDDYQHRHVPYFVILIKALNEWKNSHNGQPPKNMQEKQGFTASIKAMAKNYNEEDNFQEAVKFAHKAFKDPSELPYPVQMILESEFSKAADVLSSNFWILAKALSMFYDKYKILPVKASIPDMQSDTETFLALKEVYLGQARKDVEEMKVFTKEILGNSQKVIPDDQVKSFCDNILTIDYIHYRTIDQEFDSPLPIEIFETDCYKWHFALRGNYVFYDKHSRWPSSQITDDVKELENIINNEIIQKNYENILAIDTEICQEMARYEGAQLHTIGAILGGVASQEAIKLLTNQFKPINNTYIYKGITSEAEVYEF